MQHYIVSDGVMGDHTITGAYDSPLSAVKAWIKCHGDEFKAAQEDNDDYIDNLIVSDTSDCPEHYFVERTPDGMRLITTRDVE